MDPLSITVATIGLATFCGQAVNILLQFAGQSRSVDFTIKNFADEVSNLDRVLKSITASSKDRSITSLAAGTGHEAQHWRDVLTSLGDCRSCMTRLVKILEKLEGGDGNIFKRTKKQLRLSIESGEIAVLRRQILSFTQTMQISLQMLLLSSHLSAPEASLQAVLPRLDDINSNIQQVLKLVRAQIQQETPTLISESCTVHHIKDPETALLAPFSSNALAGLNQIGLSELNLSMNMPLRPKAGSDEMGLCEEDSSAACVSESPDSVSPTEPISVVVQTQILDTHQAVMSNMEACLRSAGSLISSVSTALTSDTEQFLASDFNGSIMGERRAGIESWITSADSDQLSGDSSDGPEPSNAVAFQSIEHEILSKFYALGKQHFEAAEYPNAEQFLVRFLTMESTNPEGDCSKRFEAREMLATSFVKQRKLIEAEKILLLCIEDTRDKDPRALRATYSLAEVYLDAGQFDKAEIYCQKSLREADGVFGRSHPLVQQSGELLLEVYRNKGDFVALEAYRSAISPGRIVQGGFSWKKAISLLNSNGFSLEGMDRERKANALRWAAEKGLENVLLVLLETKGGIKDVVDSKDRIGKTALHYASAYGHASIASILLQNGASVEITAACTMRALHLAAHYDELEVVRVLLDNGAEINSRTADGKTVLHQAIERNSLPIMQLMLSRNADIEACDKKQRTPIFMACKKNPVDAVRLLLLHRANIMARDSEGNTPLHWAAWYGQFSMVQLLVEHGADLSAKGVHDENPLGLAASNGHTRTVMVLLEYGAPTELRNSSGRTALHFASKNGNLDIVRLLVRAGANILACDKNGHSVIDVARDNRHDMVYKFVSARSHSRIL